MQTLLQRLLSLNAGAFLILGVIFVGLSMGGANSAAAAALLASALLISLTLAVFGSRPSRLARLLGANAVSLMALIAFLAFAAASALRPVILSALDHIPPLASLSPYRTWEGIAALLAPAAAFGAGALVAAHREARDWVGRWLIVGTIAYALFALARFMAENARHGGRLDADISSANAAAALFGALAILAAAQIARAGRTNASTDHSLPRSLRWLEALLRAPFSTVALILSFSCLLLTASRGGLLASGLGAAVFVLALASISSGAGRGGVRRGAVVAVVAFLSVALGVLFLQGGGLVLDRFALAPEDIHVREQLAQTHWRFFQSAPWTGYGVNTFHELNSVATNASNWQALSPVGAAHNIYVQALEEGGVIGAGLLALIMAPPLLRALIGVWQGRSGAEWSAAVLAIAALFLLQGFVDFTLQVPAIAGLFGFLLGAFAGVPSKAAKQSSGSAPAGAPEG
jgi:O-antigen ligase